MCGVRVFVKLIEAFGEGGGCLCLRVCVKNEKMSRWGGVGVVCGVCVCVKCVYVRKMKRAVRKWGSYVCVGGGGGCSCVWGGRVVCMSVFLSQCVCFG